MQQSIYYIKFALQFADMQITELVNIFNHQVGNRGWTSMRAYHDKALIDEFQRRDINTACICSAENGIQFVNNFKNTRKTCIFCSLIPKFYCNSCTQMIIKMRKYLRFTQ